MSTSYSLEEMQRLYVKINESGLKMLTTRRDFPLGNEEDTWQGWHSALEPDVLLTNKIKSNNANYEESEHHSDQLEIGKQFCGIRHISPICWSLQFEGNNCVSADPEPAVWDGVRHEIVGNPPASRMQRDAEGFRCSELKIILHEART